MIKIFFQFLEQFYRLVREIIKFQILTIRTIRTIRNYTHDYTKTSKKVLDQNFLKMSNVTHSFYDL